MPTFAEPLADNRAENLSSQNIKGYVYLPSMKKRRIPLSLPGNPAVIISGNGKAYSSEKLRKKIIAENVPVDEIELVQRFQDFTTKIYKSELKGESKE